MPSKPSLSFFHLIHDPFCIIFAFLCPGAARRRALDLALVFFLSSPSPLNSLQHLIKKDRNQTPATTHLSGWGLDIHTPTIEMTLDSSTLLFCLLHLPLKQFTGPLKCERTVATVEDGWRGCRTNTDSH